MKVHYSQLTDEQKELLGDGCGTRLTGRLVPDLFFKTSCNQHDFYYTRGGDIVDKLEADVMFYAHMIKSINDLKPHLWQKPLYVLLATIYFFGVSTLGLLFWRWGKYHTLEDMIKHKL